jgi:hypothetical protein
VPRGTPTPMELALEVHEALGADGMSVGAVSVEADGASPWPGDGAKGWLRDWVMCGTDIGAPGSAAMGDTMPAPES